MDKGKSSIVLPDGTPATRAESQKPKINFPEAFKIVGISAFGYLCAFAYEMGYCRVFGIPVDLIRIDLTVLLFCGTVAFALAVLIYQLAFIFFILRKMLSNGNKTPVRSWMLSFFPMLLAVSLLGYSESFKGLAFYMPLWMTFLYFLDAHGVPIYDWIADNRKRNYSYYFSDWRSRNKEGIDAGFYAEAKRRGMGNLIAIMVIAIIILYLSFSIGKHSARHIDTILYRAEPRPEIVVRVYGAIAITARIDDKGNVYPEFRIIQMEGQTNDFVLTKIGRLNPILPSKMSTPLLSPPVAQVTNVQAPVDISIPTNAPSTNRPSESAQK